MYRQKTKRIRLRVVLIIIIYTMTSMCFTTACQQTPEQNIVIKRDNAEKVVLNSKNNEVIPYDYNIPTKIEESFLIFENRLNLVVDAPVDMPAIKEFPVAKIRIVKFNKDIASKIIDYFTDGGQLVTPYIPTKQYYEKLIIEEKRGRLINNEYVVDEFTQQSIAELEKKRDQAPNEDIRTPITTYTVEGEGLKARIIRNNEIVGTVRADESKIAFVSPMRHRPETIYLENPVTGLEERIDSDYHMRMTADESRCMAENVLYSLGITGFKLKETTDVYYYREDIRDIEFSGYSMIFMRSFGEMMPLYVTEYTGYPEDSYDYSPPVNTEFILIDIDEYGRVQWFSWQNPIEIVETITKNVELLPYKEIMQRLREFSRHHWAWQYEQGEIPPSATQAVYSNNAAKKNIDAIKIEKISLNLLYIPLKDNVKEFMYVPCWVFAYHLEFAETSPVIYVPEDGKEMGYNYIILNAVDGGSVSVYPAEFAREVAEQENALGVMRLPISIDWY